MSVIGLRSLFRTDYTELTRLVSGRQIVRIYVCERLLHFRIGFSVIIDVFYSDAVVARASCSSSKLLPCESAAVRCSAAAASTPSVLPTSRSSNFTLPGDADTNALAVGGGGGRLTALVRRLLSAARIPYKSV